MSPLSNFHEDCPVVVNAEHFGGGSEEYYHVRKARFFNDKDAEDRIRRATSPAAQKAAAYSIRGYNQARWHAEGAEDAMRDALKAKFSQNASCRDFLLATKGKTLYEASPTDGYWGVRMALGTPAFWQKLSSPPGKNVLGRLLMEVRDQYLS